MSVTYPMPVDAPGIDAAGKGALYFVPAVRDVKAPTVAELNAGINLSCLVYSWNPNGSQGKVERTRYCYTNTAESLGRVTYAPDAIEYDYDPQKVNDSTGDYAHVAKLAPGTKGFIVDRRGLPPATQFAAGQILEMVMPVELGEQMPAVIDPKEEGQKLRYMQSVAVIGDVARRVAVVAGG
nr:MAG TPA: major tail protein [Caudoviricetes sp.]